jgi:hypothetical protein
MEADGGTSTAKQKELAAVKQDADQLPSMFIIVCFVLTRTVLA